MSQDSEWPLRARVTRGAPGDPTARVLEIEGPVGGIHRTWRHRQTGSVDEADVPALPELYARSADPQGLRRYAQLIAFRHGMSGMEGEGDRLARKIEAVLLAMPSARVRDTLLGERDARSLLDDAVGRSRSEEDYTPMVDALVEIQRRILAAQRLVDPCSKTSLTLFTDERHWTRAESYADHLDQLDPTYWQRRRQR